MPRPLAGGSEPPDIGVAHAESHRSQGAGGRPGGTYEIGHVQIDFDAYEVLVDGEPAHLCRREFQLLRALVRSPNRVLTRREIYRTIWGDDQRVSARTIDVHIRRLRMRLERDKARPELIVTVRGVGYKLSNRQRTARTSKGRGTAAADPRP